MVSGLALVLVLLTNHIHVRCYGYLFFLDTQQCLGNWKSYLLITEQVFVHFSQLLSPIQQHCPQTSKDRESELL